MASDQKPTEQQAAVDLEKGVKQWPVSLVGSLANKQPTRVGQGLWPWLLSKALFCPAAVLGANETLYQEEEPADICCLQPHSLCGPTCRELNAQACGFGNEGLKLFAHTCLLQAACSCVCLGLPFVAWLAALQRQKVVSKHLVDDSHDDFWVSTALYPCSLLQMHALLQQEQQQQTCSHTAPLRAPKVQQMTACDSVLQTPSQAVSQAPSTAGPLTSAISSSKMLRAVHNHTARSESTGLYRAAAGSRIGDSISSDTSGVVDSPDHGIREKEDSELLTPTKERSCSSVSTVRQLDRQYSTEQYHSARPKEGPLHSGALAARTHRPGSSVGGATAAVAAAGQPASSSGGGSVVAPIEMAPLSARRREQQLQQQAAGSRGSITPRVAQGRPQLPPKHRSSASSLQKAPLAVASAAATAAAGNGAAPAAPAVTLQPTGFEAVHNAPEGVVAETAPVHARASSSQLEASPSAGDAEAMVAVDHSSRALQQQKPNVGDSLASSRISAAGRYSKLQLSHEDVPLMAIKGTPGRLPRSLNNSRSGKLSLANSWQPRTSSDKQQLIPAGSYPGEQSENPSSISNASSAAQVAEDPAGATLQRQYNPQYATMQSDVCNFASWLGSAGPSTQDLHMEQSGVQEQQLSRHSSAAASEAYSEGDDHKYPPPVKQDSDLVIIGEATVVTINSPTPKGAAAAGASASGYGSQAGQGRARMSDWAYMSDLCNLGTSFDMGRSTGLAAALGRLAEESGEDQSLEAEPDEQQQSPQQQRQHRTSSTAEHRDSASQAGSHSSSNGSQPPPAERSRVASGSWPDANPSPASTLHVDSQRASSSGGAASGASAHDAASAAKGSLEQPAPATSRLAPEAQHGSRAITKTTASSAASSTVSKLDRETLAAVTGTSGTEQLTASQEELAAKLARLAFAKPSIAKKPAGARPAHQQQQQGITSSRQGTAAGPAPGETTRLQDEPFYPTMMSDMCNLAEPLDTVDEQEQQVAETPNRSTQRLLSQSKAVSAAQQSILQSVQQQRPPLRKQYKPAGHNNQHRASMQRKSLKIARASSAGPLKSALMMRRGPAAAARPGMAHKVSGAGAAAAAGSPDPGAAAQQAAATPAGASAGEYPLESFDSYYPDCQLNSYTSDVGAAAAGSRADTGHGKVTYVNPYYLYRDSTASSLVTGNTIGASPPKSPKRAIKNGHVAAAVAAFECQNAAAAAAEQDEVESDLHSPWQQDNSRSASPAVGIPSRDGQWSIVDASAEARAR